MAGRVVGGVMARAGAGSFATTTASLGAEALAFTGTNALLGNSEHLGKELVENTAMFGALRGVNKLFPNTARNSMDAFITRGAQSAANLGVIQAFNEGEFALDHGRPMTGDERRQSVVNTAAVGVALHLGGKLAAPLTERVERAIGSRFAGQRAELDRQVAGLRDGSAATPADVKRTLGTAQELWNGQNAAVEAAVREGQLSPEEAEQFRQQRQTALNEAQLDLARKGVPLNLTEGAPAYVPTKPGEIAYSGDAREAKTAYERDGGSFDKVGVNAAGDPVYVGRSKDGTTEVFVPRSSIEGGTRAHHTRRSPARDKQGRTRSPTR